MTDTITRDDHRSCGWLRPLAWGGAAALVLLPLATMRVTEQVSWEVGDFMFATFMILGAGLAFELAVRTRPSRSYRAGAAVALGAALLIVWANGAVGFIGSEANPINLMYFAIPLVALAGSLLARFRASGMAVAMAAAAAAQVAAGGVALYLDYFTGPLTVFFTGLWLASAWLLRKAARELG
jgi:hypothetical protein